MVSDNNSKSNKDSFKLPFSDGEEFVKWAGLKLAESFVSGIGSALASAIIGEIWDAFFGSGKSTEELLEEAVTRFSKKVKEMLEEKDLKDAKNEFEALMDGLDNLSIRIKNNPNWWMSEAHNYINQLGTYEYHALKLIEVLEMYTVAGWSMYMMVASLLLRIYATRMSIPKEKKSAKEIIAKEIDRFTDHHWERCKELHKSLWSLFKPIKRGNLAQEYSLGFASPGTNSSIAKDLLRTPGHYFEVNTQRLAELYYNESAQIFFPLGKKLFDKIPPVSYTLRSQSDKGKRLTFNSRFQRAGRGLRQYWVYSKKWAVYFIPETTGSEEGIRQALAVRKYSLLYWLWSYYVRTIIGSLHDIKIKWWAAEEPDKVRPVAIRAPNGEFVTILTGDNNYSQLCTLRDTICEDTVFQVIKRPTGAVAFYGRNQNYVTCELNKEPRQFFGEGRLLANRPWIGPWEEFVLKEQENNKVALFCAANERYVSAPCRTGKRGLVKIDDSLKANSKVITESEKFELVYLKRSAWHDNNLTQAIGAPMAASNPTGYVWDDDKSQHIVYRGRDNHIHELWFHRNSGWHHNGLTLGLGAPLAISGPHGYTWDVDKTQHIIYRGEDNHVHELWFHQKSGWHHNSLTLDLDAPLAASGPYGYTWDVDKTQHVVYRGKDNHIHELWFHRDSGWHHNGLTQGISAAPLAVSDPTGYVWDDDETQHIVYRGRGNHIHELRFQRWEAV